MPIEEKHHMDNAGPGHAPERINREITKEKPNPLTAEGFYKGISEIIDDIGHELHGLEQKLEPISRKSEPKNPEPLPGLPSPETKIQDERAEVISNIMNVRRKLLALKEKVTL